MLVRRAIFLLVLVARSKLIPDFALTLHFLHLIATTLYTHSLPGNWLWWGLQCASAALMTFVGMWACQWRELRPISFGGISGKASSNSTSASQAGEGSSSRGRNQDGGDEYEMAEMKGTGEQAV